MAPHIAILGWGSLIWDLRPVFDDYHESWKDSGPTLPLEFSRVSASRENALTFVLDEESGSSCRVWSARSLRKNPDDAIADLRCREGTTLQNIGFHFQDHSRTRSVSTNVSSIISTWADQESIDVVVWTDLTSNFRSKSSQGCHFTVDAAVAHLRSLPPGAKTRAAEYIWRAPLFVDTTFTSKYMERLSRRP